MSESEIAEEEINLKNKDERKYSEEETKLQKMLLVHLVRPLVDGLLAIIYARKTKFNYIFVILQS